MKKIEAKKNTQWNEYCKKSKFYGFFELKQTSGDSFLFSKFESHQVTSLMTLNFYGLTWKLSDEDQRKKPCDSMCIPPLDSYLVIWFGKYKSFVVIDIGKIAPMIVHKHKSISYKDALKISDKVVKLSTGK
jgi:hypothetical protein